MTFGSDDDDGDEGQVGPGKPRTVLELIWGEGWSLPGGPERVDRLIAGLDLSQAQVLDIGCGSGGADIYLVQKHHAAHVTGMDQDGERLAAARRKAADLGLVDRLSFAELTAGVLPFGDAQLGVVCSMNSSGRLAEDNLARESHRVLRSGGTVAVSTFVAGDGGTSSPALRRYFELAGSAFPPLPADQYRDALRNAGFSQILETDQTAWYAGVARNELASFQGAIRNEMVELFGQAVAEDATAAWSTLIAALDRGECRLLDMRARKP
ncbi:class I SAM-dependent methyltransferase [Rhodoligotrophos defluvii]|uniref:class I SAM-dependent methyltransferase n=1 Tax=Rhodoligotrophos defluvii TaxID=2561934 RepID=UPI0010C9EC54|nr:methyltransferase domain-containing protein [Rhodoligotrophos defluvii]